MIVARRSAFFDHLEEYGNRLAVVDDASNALTFADLAKRADVAFPRSLEESPRALGFLFCDTTVDHLVVYLAALRSRKPIALLNPGLDATLQDQLIRRYRPEWIVTSPHIKLDWETLGYEIQAGPDGTPFHVAKVPGENPEPHSDLSVLLSTSGSTGSGKVVRLSRRNINANANSISEFMDIQPDNRALITLPLYYSFGLSVVNSHLAAGACLLFCNHSFLDQRFWRSADHRKATFLAGLPFHYETWRRLGIEQLAPPSLQVLAQAGGRLSDNLQREFLAFSNRNEILFYVMYGQTEATARISYVPPQILGQHIGTIGQAIPGGELSLDPTTSELIYKGPNVMMGYADTVTDLTRGDDLDGRLRTGDLGTLDENGFYRIVGRLKRFIKLFGERIGLDELERDLQCRITESLACTGRDNLLVVAVEQKEAMDQVKDCLREVYRLRAAGVSVHHLEPLPHLDSGKMDYRRILECIDNA